VKNVVRPPMPALSPEETRDQCRLCGAPATVELSIGYWLCRRAVTASVVRPGSSGWSRMACGGRYVRPGTARHWQANLTAHLATTENSPRPNRQGERTRRAGVENLTPIAAACSPALPRRFAVEGAPDSLREAVDADSRRPPARPL
jgi:hypothetical protein